MTQDVACCCRGVVFQNDDFDQFEMERGYCVVGGADKYSPQLVRRKVFDRSNAWAAVAARSAEIIGRLGTFALSWSLDRFLGRVNDPFYVQARASQLRYTFFT